MRTHPEDERRRAVARVQAGESITAVSASLGRSRQWVYTWLARATVGEATCHSRGRVVGDVGRSRGRCVRRAKSALPSG